MKKNLFLLGLAVAAMTSCTNDEVLNVQQPVQKAIGFDSFVNKNSRATDNGIASFYVFGLYQKENSSTEEIFPGVEVTKGNDGKWSYTHIPQYWTANDYFFAAYAQDNDGDEIGGSSFNLVGSNGQLTIPFSITYTTEDGDETACSQHDLVADLVAVDGENRLGNTVGFTLKHLLSKITFTIINASTEGLNMTVNDLTITGIRSGGEFKSNTPEVNGSWSPTSNDWTANDGTAVSIIPLRGSNNAISVRGKTDRSAEYYVIPQSLTGINYSVTATFYQNGDPVQTETFTGIVSKGGFTGWEPATIYNYTISLPSSPNKIEFSATVDPTWTTANSANGGAIELR